MKLKIGVLVFLILVVGGGTWWFLMGQHQGDNQAHQHGENEKEVKYTCPMHPQIISDNAGSCPICGMDLVLVENGNVQDEHKGHGHEEQSDQASPDSDEMGSMTMPPKGHTDFKLTLNKQQMIGVELAKAEKKKLFKSIRAPGRIAFDPELYTAQSEYLEALRQWKRVKDSPISDVRESTNQMIRSSKIRLKVLGLSEEQISRLARKGSLSEGLLVTGKGQENWIYADIFEVDLPYIKEGLSAQITANFLQGKTLPGKVISVDQVINPENRTAKVRIQLLESHVSIRPESYVNVTIFAPVGEHTSVPLEAIMDTGRDIFVFVKKDEGQFEPRKVTLLLETENEAAIGPEVKAGEEVVVGGNFMLGSESRLKAVIKGFTEASEHNH